MTFHKRKFFIVFIIIFIFCLVLLFWPSKKTKQPTVTVTSGSVTEKAQAVGYIKPKFTTLINSQINGTVAEIYHEEGDFVKKGDPLIKVNTTPSPVEYASAIGELEKAKAEEQAARENITRYQIALKKHLISNQYGEYILAKKEYDAAKTQRLLAQQKLDLLDQGTISIKGKSVANIVYSPIDGFILYRKVNIGDPVISLNAAQTATLIMSMADLSDMVFRGVVDEMDAEKLKVGMPAKIELGALTQQTITGTLSRISLQSDKENNKQGLGTISATEDDSPYNISFKVQIASLRIPPHLTLRSGYSATADILIKEAKNVPTLPERVIYFKDDKPFVHKLIKRGKIKEQPIEIGLSDSITAEIKQGLKVGDSVVDDITNTNNDASK